MQRRLGDPLAISPQFSDAIAQSMRTVHAGVDVPFAIREPSSDVRSLRGAVLALHGGGWVMTGAETLPSMDDVADRWAARGWGILNSDYRPGAASLVDAHHSYDALRAAVGPDLPIVVAGKSAGGHLGLMIAANRSDVGAVVAESAPTTLAEMGKTKAARKVARLARTFFGPSTAELAANSPADPAVAGRMSAPILAVASAADRIVPPHHLDAMRRARPDIVQTMVLSAGPREFIHAGVSDAAMGSFIRAEDLLAARAEGAHAVRAEGRRLT